MIGKEYNWFAIYVKTQHEKRVQKDLFEKRISTYLPLVKSVHFWSDRKKIIQKALFPNYLFVKTSCIEYFQILQHPSVISYVKFGNEPAPIPESQIHTVQKVIDEQMEYLLNEPSLMKGNLVEIIRGPLKGLQGTISHLAQKSYVTILLNQIQQTIHVKIEKENLIPYREKLRACEASCY